MMQINRFSRKKNQRHYNVAEKLIFVALHLRYKKTTFQPHPTLSINNPKISWAAFEIFVPGP